MSRRRAARVYDRAKRPLDALRKWAGEKVDRLNGVVTLATVRLTSSRRSKDRSANAARAAARRADDLSEKVSDLWKQAREVSDQIANAEAEGKSIEKLQAKREAIRAKIDALEADRDALVATARRERSARDHWGKRVRFWAKVRTVYALRLRAARRKARPSFEPWMANGNPYSTLTKPVKRAIAQAVTRGGLVVTSTTGGVHSPTSYHYSGRAVDLAGPYSKMVAFQGWLARNYGSRSLEIFGPDDYYYKTGTRYPGAFPAHGDHVHFADE